MNYVLQFKLYFQLDFKRACCIKFCKLIMFSFRKGKEKSKKENVAGKVKLIYKKIQPSRKSLIKFDVVLYYPQKYGKELNIYILFFQYNNTTADMAYHFSYEHFVLFI